MNKRSLEGESQILMLTKKCLPLGLTGKCVVEKEWKNINAYKQHPVLYHNDFKTWNEVAFYD